MKILFFGNTNNYPYRMATAMHSLGIDVTLIINRPELLHRPEGLQPDLRRAYPDWIHDYSDMQDTDYIEGSERLVDLLCLAERHTHLILNHLGPTLLQYLNRPSIAWLTGSDLDYYANYASLKSRVRTWGAEFRRTSSAKRDIALWIEGVKRQREGIFNASSVSYFHRGLVPHGDMLLDSIGVDDSKRFFIYMSMDTQKDYVPPPDNPRLRIFCGTRLTWKYPVPEGASPLDYKHVDVLIRGVRLFNDMTGHDVDLILVRKGMHVDETLELARRENVDSQVTWLNEMSQAEFMNEVLRADVCVDQLGKSVVGMAGLDAMAMGRPLIANFRGDIWSQRLSSVDIPICNATTPEQVCDHLINLNAGKEYREKIGKSSMKFVQEYFSPLANARECAARLGIAIS